MMTEIEYRQLHRLSYSWIKKFIEDRMKYVDEFEKQSVLITSTDTTATKFGTLTETLLWNTDNYDLLFEDARFIKPTGHMGLFVDKLYSLTKENLDELGRVTRTMESLMEEAYNFVKFDANGNKVAFKNLTLDAVISKFRGSDAENYYQQQRSATGKHLVDVTEKSMARSVCSKLKNHWITKDLVNRETDSRYTVFYQLIVLFDLFGLEFKSMLDKVVVDHELKLISPIDLKTTYDIEDFNYNYRKYMYYLQALIYYYAIISWKNNNGLADYRVELMQFIAADSSNQLDPLIYPVKRQHMKEALEGFEDHKGIYYMGLREATDAIKWHRENNLWSISRKNFENKGYCSLQTYTKYETAV